MHDSNIVATFAHSSDIMRPKVWELPYTVHASPQVPILTTCYAYSCTQLGPRIFKGFHLTHHHSFVSVSIFLPLQLTFFFHFNNSNLYPWFTTYLVTVSFHFLIARLESWQKVHRAFDWCVFHMFTYSLCTSLKQWYGLKLCHRILPYVSAVIERKIQQVPTGWFVIRSVRHDSSSQ
jgi:hypothetical protein